MKPMANHTSHANQTSRTNTIANALKRRAQAVLNDKSIDPQSRAIIRYALETNDPWLARLVSRADAGENIVDMIDHSETPPDKEDDASDEKIEALAEIICRGGNQSAGALLVLMGMLENSSHPEAIANTVKHVAFTRCGELNLFGIVEAQIALVESELLPADALGS
jgi:hypothetical protein